MTLSLLNIEIDPVAAPREVRIAGAIDLASVEELKDALQRLATEASDLVLDFSNVTFIDSSGISALIVTSLALDPAHLQIRNASDFIRHSLTVTGVGYLCG
jgi:anti-anti-sigma factor